MKKFLQRFLILIMLFITLFTFTFKPQKANAFAFAVPVGVTVAEYLVGLAITYLGGVQISNTVSSLEINKMTSSFVNTILSVSEYDSWFYSKTNSNFYYNVGSNLYELGYDTEKNTFAFYLMSDNFNILFSSWNDSSAYDDLYNVEGEVLVPQCNKDNKSPISKDPKDPEGNKYLISASVSYYLMELCGTLTDNLTVDENGVYTGTLKVDNFVQQDSYKKTFYTSPSEFIGSTECPSVSELTVSRVAIKDSSKNFDVTYVEKSMYDNSNYTGVAKFTANTSLGTNDNNVIKFSDLSNASYFKLLQTSKFNSYYQVLTYNFDFCIIDPMNNYYIPLDSHTVNHISYFDSGRIGQLSSQGFAHDNWKEDTRVQLDFSVTSQDVFYVTDSTSDVTVDSSSYPNDEYSVTVDPSQYDMNSNDLVNDDFINNVADNVNVNDSDNNYNATVKGVTVQNSKGDTVSDGSTKEDTDNKSFFQSILDFLKSILDAILNLPHLIATAFEYLFDKILDILKTIVDVIKDIFSSIADLPKLIYEFFKGILNDILDVLKSLATSILEGLKNLFIPQSDYWSSKIDSLKEKFSEHLNTDSYVAIFGTTFEDQDVKDLVFDLGFTTLVVKLSYYNAFKSTLKFVLTGAFIFLLAIYNYRQVYKLIRGSSYADGGDSN